MSDDAELDYAYLAQNALRQVVKDVLGVTKDLGMPPGEHHFYIEFATRAPGVAISEKLKAQYPERMTIVLQHQFEGLDVREDGFSITLHFKGVPDTLVIPYEAITQFADPSVNFALQFPMVEVAAEEAGPSADVEQLSPRSGAAKGEPSPDDEGPDDDGPSGAPSGGSDSGSAEIVSIDRFRKK